MDNIYKVLEKLKEVTDRAPVMEVHAAVDASKMNKKKNYKPFGKDDPDYETGLPKNAKKDPVEESDDGIFADTALSMDKLAKLKEVEETAGTIRTQLKDAMMSRLAELAGVPLAEIEEAVTGESSDDAASRIRSEVVLDDEEVDEGNEFSGALAQAKKDGKSSFDVDGKTYSVEEAAMSDEEKERAMKRARNMADEPERGTDAKKVSLPKAPWDESVDEAAKPDFADIDGDGDKDEDMKKAAKDKEVTEEHDDCMVCKDCGDEMGKPTTDCEHDCNDESGDWWEPKSESSYNEEEVKETTSAGAMAVDASGGGKALYKNASVYEGNEIIRSAKRLMEGMNINVSMNDQSGPSLTVTATDEDAQKLGALLQLAGLGNLGMQQEAVAEDQEFANGADDTATADTETLVNTISGGLNAQHRQINPNNPGDNPMAMQGMGNNTVNIDEDLTESHLMTLYQEFKTK